MNQRKLNLLNKRVKEEKFYSLVLEGDSLKIVTKRGKMLKPFWKFNKTKQKMIKKFSLSSKEVSLEYNEEELIEYMKGEIKCLK